MSTATAATPAAPAAPVLKPASTTPVEREPSTRPQVVVIGGGFGGLEAAKKFKGEDVDVTLIDRSNHHLFQPLLYQVATGGLSTNNIARPLREIFRHQKNVEVVLSEVRRVDVEARKVITEDLVIPYDFLILATGARHSYFGHDEWEKFAPGLKNLADAIEIRKRMLTAFEIAEKAVDQAERDAAMTFVIVGGGPTGVEMAGAISEIARHTMTRDFRCINSARAKIMIIEGGPRILGGFAPELSVSGKKAVGADRRRGPRGIDRDQRHDRGRGGEGRPVPARPHGGLGGRQHAASPLGKTLGAPTDKAGRVVVNEDLTIPGHPEVQVIGDLANFSHQTGKPLPGVSPPAMQEGRHAARNVMETLAGGKPMKFVYWDKGSLATIGRNKAVADLNFGLRFGGFIAWVMWAAIHIVYLVGYRSRIAVLFASGSGTTSRFTEVHG